MNRNQNEKENPVPEKYTEPKSDVLGRKVHNCNSTQSKSFLRANTEEDECLNLLQELCFTSTFFFQF